MRTLALLVVLLFAHRGALAAQGIRPDTVAAETEPPLRSPATARFLGTVFPGGGHIYAGEYVNGARYYYGTACGIGGGALAFAVSGMSPEKGAAWPLQVSGVLLMGLGVAVWVRGAIDAPRAAARANVKHTKPAARLSLVLQPSGTSGRRTNLGLAIAW